MSEKEELKERKAGEGLVFAPLEGQILPERLSAPSRVQKDPHEWQQVETCRFQPNPGFLIGLMGTAMGLLMLLQSLLTVVVAAIAGRGSDSIPIDLSYPMIVLVFCAFLLFFSIRKEARLLLSSLGLRVEREDGADELALSDIESVSIKPDKKLRLRLKSGREMTLPAVPWYSGNPPPFDVLVNWFRRHGVTVVPLAVLTRQVHRHPISLPELLRPINWPKWGLGLALVILVAASASLLVMTELRLWRSYPELRTWFFLAPVAGLVLEFFCLLAPMLMRRLPCKSTLEFVETGIRVRTKGVAEPILDHGSFKRFVIESRVDWFRVTRKRLCAETHYGRRIPLTGFALNWPLEAEQILHQAGERGIPVVLRREGDEEPLEIP